MQYLQRHTTKQKKMNHYYFSLGSYNNKDPPFGKLIPKAVSYMSIMRRNESLVLIRRLQLERRIAYFCNYSRSLSSSSQSSSPSPPPYWKVAIVGSGPSGCYTAKYLNSALSSSSVQIDVLERLPTPYGLVRSGVAPDHPEVKNVQNDFDGLFQSNNNIQFYGNVTVGRDISLNDLRRMYDVVVLSYGCESDRPFNHIQNSNLVGVLSAREFVAWYNGHVDYDWVGPIVQKALLNSSPTSPTTNNVVVIGHGNVALDCARILAKTRNELDSTDIATRALDILHSDSIQQQTKTIHVVGRRGHVQGAFTIKELRELTKLENTNFVVREDELNAGRSTPASQQELKDGRPRKRMDKLLTDAAVSSLSSSSQEMSATKSQLHLRFLLNPIAFESDDGTNISRVVCERTRLSGQAGNQIAKGTGETETLKAQLALISIGYKGVPIPGTEQWFDNSRGILTNTHGLVDKSTPTLGGLYVSGWLKRGPSGIIGTNIADSKDTVATIIENIKQSPYPKNTHSNDDDDSKSLLDLFQEYNIKAVDWNGYQKIEAFENSKGQKRNQEQPREKITSRMEQLEVAFSK